MKFADIFANRRGNHAVNRLSRCSQSADASCGDIRGTHVYNIDTIHGVFFSYRTPHAGLFEPGEIQHAGGGSAGQRVRRIDRPVPGREAKMKL